MQKARETQLEINLKALHHNFLQLKGKLQPQTLFMAVVKANAYGSDAVAVAKFLEDKADYFAVAYTTEGIELREAGIRKPILVLHPQSVHFEEIIDYCLEPALYSHFVLNAFLLTAQLKKQQHYPVHLKFNTGLNRLGFDPDEAKDLATRIHKNPQIKIRSVFSHLAASEDPNERDFTLRQIAFFSKIRSAILENLPYKPLFHCTNTSGIINYPDAHFDMVRSGIGLYGYGNEARVDQSLKPIATLKTIISQLHTIQPGDTVGYNRAFEAPKLQKIATLPIGHADGLSRRLGNGVGFVTIHGQKAPYVGNVCMDMLMVNVTGITCEEGDEVVVFGENPTAETLAQSTETITYEVLTKISKRIKRVIE
ncbi:MAG: alanine racemase [Flavobacteriaceae bacterium]|nr:alanine racemase [Flavobacteriaceae bacterium]